MLKIKYLLKEFVDWTNRMYISTFSVSVD